MWVLVRTFPISRLPGSQRLSMIDWSSKRWWTADSSMASYKIKSRPWSNIVGFYRDMVKKYGHSSLKPMLGFVERIHAAEFADRIYGATSHAQLLISQLPEFDPDGQLLYVELDSTKGQIKFEYQETSSPLYKRWRRACSPEDSFPVFQRFLKRVKWFYPQ